MSVQRICILCVYLFKNMQYSMLLEKGESLNNFDSMCLDDVKPSFCEHILYCIFVYRILFRKWLRHSCWKVGFEQTARVHLWLQYNCKHLVTLLNSFLSFLFFYKIVYNIDFILSWFKKLSLIHSCNPALSIYKYIGKYTFLPLRQISVICKYFVAINF